MTHGKGASPVGTSTEAQASAYVRDMFGRVAPRYDLLNHLLSFQTDRYWRALTVRRVEHILRRPNARVVDLCCGTGDLTLALRARAHRKARIQGSDFCHPMLVTAGRKSIERKARITYLEADALQLPLASRSLDLITVAFGFRNLANYHKGLQEMQRVLKPGGMLAILEFSTPPSPVFRGLYNFYSRSILPAIGGALSGSRDAYQYLPESVRKFPQAENLAAEMEFAGYTRVRFERLTFGIVALHTGLAG